MNQIFKEQSKARRLLLVGWLLVMLLLPFHAFISTWGGTVIGPLEVWKVWKELLLIGLLIPTGWLVYKEPTLRQMLLRSWLVRLILVYGVLHLVVALLISHDADATLYGLAINLRFLLFLIVSMVAFWQVKVSRHWLAAVVLVPCGLVVVFGLLQLLVLPTDFLTHFGYQKGVTIAPTTNIDEQPDQVRIMSTLRGPNPLGAYLILPGVLLVAGLISRLDWVKQRFKIDINKRTVVGILFFGAVLLALYGTHSRSAWLGFMIAAVAYILLKAPPKLRIGLLGVGAAVALIGGLVVYQYRSSSFVETVILHDNPETGAEITSNAAHSDAIAAGLKDIAERPITGCGPGCAGPASFYNQTRSHLAENYFIQIGQEVGAVGLVLFMAIIAIVAVQLYRLRSDTLAFVLLGSLIGISVANLLLHVWADDTLAYVWWGLAGVVLVSQLTFGADRLQKQRPKTDG